MVKIYGLSEARADELAELTQCKIYDNQANEYEIELLENVRVQYSFGELTLSDEVNNVTLDCLDFVKIFIE